MMMRGNRIDHLGIDAIAFAEFCPEHGMRAFLVVVHGFANVMQEAAHLGHLYICADLSRKDTC